MKAEAMKQKGMAGDIPVYCAFDEIVPLEDLKPNPRNPNQHPEAQIELLAKVIQYQGWRAPVAVSTLSGFIVRGHGRYMAATLLGCPVPVDYQHYNNEDEELADLVADNRLAELSEIDNKMLMELFAEIDTDCLPIEITGYDKEAFDALVSVVSEEREVEETYTKKVESPIYEVTGETPEVHELFDSYKLNMLLDDIESDGSITDEEREFLRLAAHRHVVFDYRNIAEYYAAASPAMQGLMEDSGLVIIDFGKAIEQGYVRLKNNFKEAIEGEVYEDEA